MKPSLLLLLALLLVLAISITARPIPMGGGGDDDEEPTEEEPSEEEPSEEEPSSSPSSSSSSSDWSSSPSSSSSPDSSSSSPSTGSSSSPVQPWGSDDGSSNSTSQATGEHREMSHGTEVFLIIFFSVIFGLPLCCCLTCKGYGCCCSAWDNHRRRRREKQRRRKEMQQQQECLRRSSPPAPPPTSGPAPQSAEMVQVMRPQSPIATPSTSEYAVAPTITIDLADQGGDSDSDDDNGSIREPASTSIAVQPAANLRVTPEGSLSQPVRNASKLQYRAAVEFCQANPPKAGHLSAEQVARMSTPAAWQFGSDSKSVVQVKQNVLCFPGATHSVFATLPVPTRQVSGECSLDLSVRDVYYYEVTVIDADPTASMACGVSSQPYPPGRLPGWHHWSVAYHSDDGRVFASNGGKGRPYAKPWRRDDVVGVGLDTATGRVFFTRNGTRLPDVANCVHPRHLLVYPAVGADGRCTLRVNFGTEPFCWTEANERRYGYDIEQLPRYDDEVAPPM